MVTAEKRTLQIEARLKDLFSRDLNKMEKALVKFGVYGVAALKGIVSHTLSLKTAVIGLTGGYLGLQGVSLVRKFGEEADAMLKLAKSTGDSIENLSELQAALSLAGVKSEQFDGLLRALLNSTRQALDGNGEFAESFAALGVSIEDLQSLSPSQLFEKMAAGLEGFSSEQDRAIALSKILPKQFLALLPLVGQGLEKFQAAILEVREAGATVTETQAKTAERLNDAVGKVEIAMGSVGRAIIEAFGPRSAALLETLANSLSKNKDAFVEIAGAIGTGIVKAVDIALNAIIGLIETIESIPGVDLFSGEEQRLERIIKTNQKLIRAAGLSAGGELHAEMEAAMKALADLQKQSAKGLGYSMRMAKQDLEQQLSDLTNKIRQSTASDEAKTPDQTAAALGLPNSEDMANYAKSVGEAMKQVSLGKVQNPVMRPVPKNDRLPSPEDEPVVGRDRERLALKQQLGGLAGNLEPIKQALREIDRQSFVLSLQEAKDKGVINATELAQAVAYVNDQFAKMDRLVTGGDFFAGFSAGAKRAIQSWTDFTAAGEEAAAALVDGGLNSLTDSFADIITGASSAKEAFKDFARQMLGDLARIISKMFIMNTLSFALGLEDGGVVPAMETGGVLRKFASGGVNRNGDVARRPTVLFGEGRTAEAFVPLPDNRSIPVSFVGGGAGGGQVTNINITAMDSRDVQRVLLEQQGTLRTIWTNQAETRHGMRQVIKRVVA